MTQHHSAGWFPQQKLQTLLGVSVSVTSNCAFCQLCHRGNLRDLCVTKFATNSVAHDSASVSWLVSTVTVANFIGSVCGRDLGLCDIVQ